MQTPTAAPPGHRSTAEWLTEAKARGLFRVGLPAPYGGDGGYRAIAATARDLMAESGRPGVAMTFAVRQLVGRFFIAENGTEAQKAEWLPRLAAGDVPTSIAISEAGAGAHPKLLTTRAERADGAGWRLTGEKAWVTNAPVAQLIVVVAIVGEENGRKRYGAFLVPRDTPGLVIKAGADAGKHGAHCPVALEGCVVPDGALLDPGGDAYAKLALPFRTLEDSIAASVQAAALRYVLEEVAPAVPAEALSELGALVGLSSLLARGAEAAAAALDAGNGHDTAALVGVRVLAADVVARIKALPGGGADGADATRLLTEVEAMENVARRARLAYQERLATALVEQHHA
jgi:acyl-CoA dehydrogenase